MKPPKSITVNSLGPGTLTITVKMGARLKARIRLALMFMRLAGWILGKRVEVKDDTANAHADGSGASPDTVRRDVGAAP